MNFHTLNLMIKLFYSRRDQPIEVTLNILKWKLKNFFKFLINMTDKLTIHFYLAKCQSRYLKHLKNHLNEAQNTCIILADFSENCMMAVQDKIQSFYFNKPQCIIHPLVLYLPSSNQSSS